MRKLIVIIILLISSFSYYGLVDENGEKVTDLENLVEKQNIAVEEIKEEQNNVDVGTVERNENVETEQKSKKNEEQEINTVKVQEKSKQTSTNTEKQQTKVEKIEKETPTTTKPKIDNTNTSTKNNHKQESSQNNGYTEKEVQVAEKTECVGNKHKMESGNTGKWFDTKAQADSYYNTEIEKWGKQWENDEITKEEYLKKCPSGYEVWTCPQCQKWTINFYYR